MEFIEVLKTNQISAGSLRTVDLGEKTITLAQVGDDYYAFDDTCSHARCSLGEGFLDGRVVECSCHGAKFDIVTGQVLALPATLPIRTYPIKVEGDSLYIGIE